MLLERSLLALSLGALSFSCRDQPPLTRPDPAVSASEVTSSEPAVSSEAKLPPFVPQRVSHDGKAMGTHLGFAAFTTPELDEAKLHEAFEAAIHEIERVEALMTTWRPTSVISQINAAAGKSAVKTDDETRAVIRAALDINAKSSGTFDITFETMHGLWKFDEDWDPHPPSDKAIAAILPHVGSKHIHVDDAAGTVMLDDPKVRISLGGIAKGYAVDKAREVLEKKGLKAFYAQAGGDLYAKGTKPDGTPWSAGIRDPRDFVPPGEHRDPKYFALLPLTDHAFSTAGDYERSYVLGGKRYHHIIDPRTGKPATACRSVTIWAPSALVADEIDDAVFILGPEKGMKLVEETEGVGAVIVDAKNNLWISKRLEGKLTITGVPTDGI